MRAAAAAFARARIDVLVDDVFVDPTWLDGWREELARSQVEVLHHGIEYDLTVDTSRQSPEECARAILAALVRLTRG